MLKAAILQSKGFRNDCLFEVSADGSPIATLNETKFTFELAGAGYIVLRKGAVAPVYELKAGETILATATQAPMLNKYTLLCGDKEWIFKAMGILASKFGLFLDDKQLGIISTGGFMNKLKDITVDLPDEVPRSVQLFLLLILARKWTDTSS